MVIQDFVFPYYTSLFIAFIYLFLLDTTKGAEQTHHLEVPFLSCMADVLSASSL